MTNQQLHDYRNELLRYCRKLTGSDWEAEDVVQETYARVYRLLAGKERPIEKSYLVRTARNVWVDLCRRRQGREQESFTETAGGSGESPYLARELIESLVDKLTVTQAVVVLLMDVFDFTAKETAALIGSTDRAVLAAAHRARSRLRALRDRAGRSEPSSGEADPALVDALVESFRERRPERIYRAYLNLRAGGLRLSGLRAAGGRFHFLFTDPDGNLLSVVSGSENIFSSPV